MILDEQSIELCALHSLGMLDADEHAQVERECRVNPDMAACLADFRDAGAAFAVASSETSERPPLEVLTKTLQRIDAPTVSRRQPSQFDWRLGLAACAAGVALITGGIVVVDQWRTAGNPDGIVQKTDAPPTGEGQVVILRNGKEVATIASDDRSLQNFLNKLERTQRLRPNMDVIQNVDKLKRELRALRKADAERFVPGPRVARTVYIEMVEPGAEAEADTETDLSERVTDFIADVLESEVGQAGISEPLEPVEEPDEPDAVIIVPDGSDLAPNIDELNSDVPTFYRDFPAGSDDFERIDDGRVWDSANQRIWIETDEPGTYQATLPPAGFDPDFIEDYTGLIPEARTLEAPVAEAVTTPVVEPEVEVKPEPPVVEPVSSEAAVDPTAAPSPVAVTVYEQTTGRGSVVVGHLPPVDDGLNYQLWMRNAADDQVVSIGVLPAAEQGVERFDFDLFGPGITPAGFFLTLEPEGGVETPGETIILQGP